MASLFLSDAEVADAIGMPDAIAAMRRAFLGLGRGQSAVQDRVRVHAGGVSLSMMGGIDGAGGAMGAKVYSTFEGRFDFVVPLFSTQDGRLLRVVQGNQLTRLRTAAVTRVVADALAAPGRRRLAIFGSGVQARAHAQAFCHDGFASEVLVCALEDADVFAAEIHQRFGVAARAVDAHTAVAQAELVITATRSTEPLFDGSLLAPGALVMAIGSSKPTAREIDDTALARAGRIVVESASQALREAGELVLAGAAAGVPAKLVELGTLLAGERGTSAAGGDLTVYKSVGIGLEDVVLALLAHERVPL